MLDDGRATANLVRRLHLPNEIAGAGIQRIETCVLGAEQYEFLIEIGTRVYFSIRFKGPEFLACQVKTVKKSILITDVQPTLSIGGRRYEADFRFQLARPFDLAVLKINRH